MYLLKSITFQTGKFIFLTVMFWSQIGYEDTWIASFNGDTTASTNYINSMMTHVQAYYCLDSLGTKIQVEVSTITNEPFTYDANWNACLRQLESIPIMLAIHGPLMAMISEISWGHWRLQVLPMPTFGSTSANTKPLDMSVLPMLEYCAFPNSTLAPLMKNCPASYQQLK